MNTRIQEMPTLNAYFELWIERKKSTTKQATPYRYEKWYRNHISQHLGGKNLCAITRGDVLRLQESLTAEYSASSVNYTISLLKTILNAAIDDELINTNPAAKVRTIKTTASSAAQTYHRALTEEEQLLFMRAAKESFYYEFFAILLLTGLRHGEAAALHWNDIDWPTNMIRVSKTLTYDLDGHVVVGPPKSDSSKRDIPMNESIRNILLQQGSKTAGLLQTSLADLLAGDHRIFFHKLHPEGYLNNRTANSELRKILQKLAEDGEPIPSFTLHAFRDTFATRFIEQGGNPQTLKTILGHSSLSMTMDLYSHVMDNTKQKEMDQLRIPL